MRVIDNFLLENKNRIVGLDIIRSIAILVVVYAHGVHLIPHEYRTLYSKIHPNIDGVSIFFVLSGFLIGGILLKIIKNSNFTHKDLWNFWVRRWFRTLPNYFLILIVIVLISSNEDLKQFNYKFFFFAQNLFTAQPLFFMESWSLSIEEWFYLLFPLLTFLVLKLLKNKKKSILYAAFIFITVPLIIRIVKYQLGLGIEDFDGNYRMVVALRLDTLMYGVFAAYIYAYKHSLWIKYKNICLVFGIILLVFFRFKFFHLFQPYPPISFNLESITVLLFMPYLSELKSTGVKLIDTFFIFISIISYSMYLFNHTIVLWHIMPFLHTILKLDNLSILQSIAISYFLYWFFTIFLSYLLYHLYEKRMTKLRDKIKF